ncbi:unnamed protein product [Clavelina lepadiformis]|uniref:Uncharacterized protein n=1 Tax=Clavelina lepadiformis TaxID=159417 RepID=A0ABP0H0D5_CLALP
MMISTALILVVLPGAILATAGSNLTQPVSTGRNLNLQILMTRQLQGNGWRCLVQDRFVSEVPHGIIFVTCLWRQFDVHNMIYYALPSQGYFQDDWMQFYGVQEKGLGYFRRDSFLSVCQLECTEGYLPFPRYSILGSTGATEPTNLNVGCDDWHRLQCRKTCPAFNNKVANGDVQCSQGLFVGSTCSFTCHKGYLSLGRKTKSCSNVGWSNNQPFKCIAIPKCSPTTLILNGELDCTDDNNLLSRCSLNCNFGYQAHGPIEQICLQSNDSSLAWYWLETTDNDDTIPRFVQEDDMRCENPTSTEDTNLVSGSGIDLSAALNATSALFNGSSSSVKRPGECDVDYDDRRACGNLQTNQQICEDNNCCWDVNEYRAVKCYYKNGNNKDPKPVNTILSNSGRLPQKVGQLHELNQPTNTQAQTWLQNAVHPLMRGQCGCPQNAGQCSASSGCPITSHAAMAKSCTLNSVIASYSRDLARIYCGFTATAEEWPWHALIYFNGQICGGTLVAAQYVITAAHCLQPTDGSMDGSGQNYVFLGVSDSSRNDPVTQARHIFKVMRHPNFTLSSLGYAKNDIAVLKLLLPADISGKYVRPLCLPLTRYPELDDECFITGFGKTSPSNDKVKTLQAANVPLVTMLQCIHYFGHYVSPGENICAGSSQPNSPDTCKGDSGGPLVCRRKHSRNTCDFYLAGITSYGRDPCGEPGPSVFTNVIHYQGWVTHAIAALENGG